MLTYTTYTRRRFPRPGALSQPEFDRKAIHFIPRDSAVGNGGATPQGSALDGVSVTEAEGKGKGTMKTMPL